MNNEFNELKRRYIFDKNNSIEDAHFTITCFLVLTFFKKVSTSQKKTITITNYNKIYTCTMNKRFVIFSSKLLFTEQNSLAIVNNFQ